MAFAKFGEDPIVLDKYSADDRRVIRVTDIRHMVRDEIILLVRIGESEACLGNHEVGYFLIGSLGVVLNHISQQLQLIHQMRELGCMNLGKLKLQLWQLVVNAMQNFRRNLGRVVMNIICDIGHGQSLTSHRQEASPGHSYNFQIHLGQSADEALAVPLGEHAIVEHGDDSTVILCADKPADALTEF